MKKVIVSIQNGLLAEALTATLSSNGGFQACRVKSGKCEAAVQECILTNADILLFEVAYIENNGVEDIVRESRKLRQMLPQCKIVLLCDETSSPNIAMDIRNAKKDASIDAFLYTSVSISYLLATLDTL